MIDITPRLSNHTCSPIPVEKNLRNKLLVWYPLDEGSGTVAYDRGYQLLNANLNAGVSWAPSTTGWCAYSNGSGTSSIDPNQSASSQNINEAFTGRTHACWVWPTNSSATYQSLTAEGGTVNGMGMRLAPAGYTAFKTGSLVWSNNCELDPLTNGWTQIGSGVVSLGTGQGIGGSNAYYKSTNTDPNGAYTSIGATMSDFQVIWYCRHSSDLSGGNADRWSVNNPSTGTGYGVAMGSGGLTIEKRTGTTWAAASIGTAVSATRDNNWATYRFTKIGSNLSVEFYSDQIVTDFKSATITAFNSLTDSTYSNFSGFAIHGGGNYYTDNISFYNVSSSPGIVVQAGVNNNNIDRYATGSGLYATQNEWTHVAAVFDGPGSTGKLTLYINGQQAGITSGIVSPIPAHSGHPVFCGCNTANNGTAMWRTPSTSEPITGMPYYGYIKDIRVYERALSSGEIAQLAMRGEDRIDRMGFLGLVPIGTSLVDFLGGNLITGLVTDYAY